jgi:hypothetical protein
MATRMQIDLIKRLSRDRGLEAPDQHDLEEMDKAEAPNVIGNNDELEGRVTGWTRTKDGQRSRSGGTLAVVPEMGQHARSPAGFPVPRDANREEGPSG